MSSVHIRKTLAFAAATALLVLALIAAGCGSARTANNSSATRRSAAEAWHQVVLCARAHGMPSLADPHIDSSGDAIFPSGLTIPAETRRACQPLYDRLIPNGEHHTPTAGQLASLLRFARCMRGHGIPDWPDPRPDGTFVPDARLSHLLKSVIRPKLTACEHLNPDPHGRVYFSRP